MRGAFKDTSSWAICPQIPNEDNSGISIITIRMKVLLSTRHSPKCSIHSKRPLPSHRQRLVPKWRRRTLFTNYGVPAHKRTEARAKAREADKVKRSRLDELLRSYRQDQFPGTPIPSGRAPPQLPDDIAVKIFKHYVPTVQPANDYHPTKQDTPLVLASVCHAWSRIVHATPCLWNFVLLVLKSYKYDNQLDLLESWFERTGDCRLQVFIRPFNDRSDTWARESFRRVYHLVSRRAAQITLLDLQFNPDSNFHFRGLDNLERLRVHNGGPGKPTFRECRLTFEAPKLGHLSVYGVHTSCVRITDKDNNDRAHELHSLQTRAAPFNGSLSILTPNQNPPSWHQSTDSDASMDDVHTRTHSGLVLLDFDNTLGWQDMEEPVAETISLPNLQHIYCTSTAFQPSISRLLKRISSAPNLKTLKISISHDPNFSLVCMVSLLADISALIHRSGCQLQFFYLSIPTNVVCPSTAEFWSMLMTQRNLQTVHIKGIAPTSQHQGLSAALVSLMRPEFVTDVNGTPQIMFPHLFPRVCQLWYEGPTANDFTAKDFVSMFAERKFKVGIAGLDECTIISTTGIQDAGDDSVRALKEILVRGTRVLDIRSRRWKPEQYENRLSAPMQQLFTQVYTHLSPRAPVLKP